MSGAHYKCVHFDSNDPRGVEVGLFYRPDKFTLMGCEPVKLVLRSGREYIGRDILAAWGEIEGEMFAFYVCHFLSRRAGVSSSAGFRRAGAETARDHAAQLRAQYPDIKVVIMGDMNDSPSDESLSVLLHAHKTIFNVPAGEYFNPFWALMEEGKGTSIQDNAVLHTEKGHPLTVGDNVTVGHGAIVHCASVGSNTLIGMGAVLLDGAVIGDHCVIGAGAATICRS